MGDILRDSVLQKLGVRCVFPSALGGNSETNLFTSRCMLEAAHGGMTKGTKGIVYEDTQEDIVVMLKLLAAESSAERVKVRVVCCTVLVCLSAYCT